MNFLNNISNMVFNNMWIALVMYIVAGIISSFSPCVLTTLPLIIGYVGGTEEKDKKQAFKYSLMFSLGIVLTFTTLGVISSVLGKFFNLTGKWWYLFLGIIMLLVGLQMLGILGGNGKKCRVSNKKRGLLGAFFLGILGGVLSSPCSTPVLAAILAFVASKGNIFLGTLMLLLYSLGHCVLIVIAGTSVGVIENLACSQKYIKVGKWLKVAFAIVVIFLGLYLLYLGM